MAINLDTELVEHGPMLGGVNMAERADPRA